MYIVSFAAITVNFTVQPGNLTVAETSTANITYNCSVQVDPMSDRILMQHWSLRFPDVPGSFSTMDFDNSVALQQRGITYDELTSSLTVQPAVENNGTLLRCTVRPNGITEFSEPIQLTLAGKFFFCKYTPCYHACLDKQRVTVTIGLLLSSQVLLSLLLLS